MNRRNFLSIAACLVATNYLDAALIPLNPPGPGGQPMRAFVQHPKLVQQACPFWCWAASISMIFESHGHAVDQGVIVQRSFNSQIVNCTSANSTTVGRALSQTWVDANGNPFHSHVNVAYDYFNGFYNINNYILINELSNDNPLLYANKQHAMVIVSVDYLSTNSGPVILGVGVLDPWPYNQGFHFLMPNELSPAHRGGDMTFLASVMIN